MLLLPACSDGCAPSGSWTRHCPSISRHRNPLPDARSTGSLQSGSVRGDVLMPRPALITAATGAPSPSESEPGRTHRTMPPSTSQSSPESHTSRLLTRCSPRVPPWRRHRAPNSRPVIHPRRPTPPPAPLVCQIQPSRQLRGFYQSRDHDAQRVTRPGPRAWPRGTPRFSPGGGVWENRALGPPPPRVAAG